MAALPLLLSACLMTSPTFDATTDPTSLQSVTLTTDFPRDTFTYTRRGGTLAVSAPTTNSGGDTRQLYWPSDGPIVAAEQSCETWNGSNGDVDQQGIALRIAPTADGRGTRAITITKNVWFYAYWIFNVHVWDTTKSGPFRQVAGFDLSSVVGPDDNHLVPYPWHVCGRVLGNLLQFMVWTGTHPQPSWSDAAAVRQVTLPAGWDYPGRAGWYVGHLCPGDVTGYTGLQTWALQGTIDPPTTAASGSQP